MAAKGSKQEPYSQVELFQMIQNGNWNGGWAIVENEKMYVFSVSEYYNSGVGRVGNPFPNQVYSKMSLNGQWTGGWVEISSSIIKYVTSSGTEHQRYREISGSSDRYEFGSREYPYTTDVYDEIVDNEQWYGGWVGYANGDPHYMDIGGHDCGSTGSNCASCAASLGTGSGSGSESSCGGNKLRAGSEHFRPMEMMVTYDLLITWGEGEFALGQTPSLSVSLIDHLSNTSSGLSAEWDGPFRVKIPTEQIPEIALTTGDIPAFYYYTIPGHYWH